MLNYKSSKKLLFLTMSRASLVIISSSFQLNGVAKFHPILDHGSKTNIPLPPPPQKFFPSSFSSNYFSVCCTFCEWKRIQKFHRRRNSFTLLNGFCWFLLENLNEI